MTGTQREEWEMVAERSPTDDIVFFGGTALSRTHLADARLSEDIAPSR